MLVPHLRAFYPVTFSLGLMPLRSKGVIDKEWNEFVRRCLCLPPVYLKVFFGYSWFTVFCQFLLYRKVTQIYIYIHSSTHVILHHVPSQVTSAVQQDLMAYPLQMHSLHLLTPTHILYWKHFSHYLTVDLYRTWSHRWTPLSFFCSLHLASVLNWAFAKIYC